MKFLLTWTDLVGCILNQTLYFRNFEYCGLLTCCKKLRSISRDRLSKRAFRFACHRLKQLILRAQVGRGRRHLQRNR